MKKEYELHGMSCGGCVSNVKRALLQVPDVTEAEVQLNPQGAIITMNKSIAVDELQAQLRKAGHYTIKEVVSNSSA
jgi:copper chaperone CopZ